MTPKDITNKTIIVAPLDWGMGHLTRCSVLIQQFLSANNKVVLAGTQFQCDWMIKEYPLIHCEIIDGYKVTLDSEKSTYWQMILQSSRMSKVMKLEYHKAEELIQKYNAHVIVSDNRYGFRSDKVKSILITHQLSPPVPRLRSLVAKRIKNWVNKFSYCWIPDNNENPLCAELNNVELKIPKIYIGHLSRFKNLSLPQQIEYCFIASGPSPQIEHFSKMVSEILERSNQKYVLVVPFEMGLANQVVNPSTEKLNELICQSARVISRAGYTTIMELHVLNKPVILIPTPGQFEQEYLSENLKFDGVKFISEPHLDKYFTSFID